MGYFLWIVPGPIPSWNNAWVPYTAIPLSKRIAYHKATVPSTCMFGNTCSVEDQLQMLGVSRNKLYEEYSIKVYTRCEEVPSIYTRTMTINFSTGYCRCKEPILLFGVDR